MCFQCEESISIDTPTKQNENNQMPHSKKKTVMIFKIASEKFTELTSFVDCDKDSLIVLTPVEQISSGAIFQEKTILETLFEEFENAS